VEESSSFFLTEASVGRGADEDDETDAALQAAEAAALDTDFWSGADSMFDQQLDMRTAVNALKAALDRPPVVPTNANANHLRLTASLQGRRREKFALAASHATVSKAGRRLANGMELPDLAGGAADNMAAGLSGLHQRMGQQAGAAGGAGRRSDDPAGDEYVASLGSMLNAMGEMQVGASGAAPPRQPTVV